MRPFDHTHELCSPKRAPRDRRDTWICGHGEMWRAVERCEKNNVWTLAWSPLTDAERQAINA